MIENVNIKKAKNASRRGVRRYTLRMINGDVTKYFYASGAADEDFSL